ncbi:MAG: DUF3247 family protein [Luteimonas sp.]
MSRIAPKVYRDPARISGLQALAMQLPQSARVEVTLDDGSCLRGIVSMRPAIQAFYDARGEEGTNGVVRIEAERAGTEMDAGPLAGSRYVWLDHINRVEALPNQTPPQASTRYPVDPNAPTVETFG